MTDEMIKALSGSMAGVTNPSEQAPDMVERVARALCARHYADRFGRPTDDVHVLRNVESNWFIFQDSAATAIEAMREPTGDMRHAGFSADAFRTPMARMEADFEPKAVWQAMIAAALPSPAIDPLTK